MASTLITRLETWLYAKRPDFCDSLRRGVDASELDDFERELGFQLPATFKELYMWRDGQDGVVPPSIQNNRHFMPLEDVRRTWKMLTGMQEHGQWEEPQWWSRGWVPFLDNGAGSNLCVDMLGSFTGRAGQVIEFWGKFDDRPIVAPDFDTWLDHFVFTLEQGFWARQEGGNFSPIDGVDFPKIDGYPIVGDSNEPLPTSDT